MIQDNLSVSKIKNGNEDCVIGGEDRGTVNHGTSANSSSHAESSWHLNEFTEGAVAIELGGLFQYFMN